MIMRVRVMQMTRKLLKSGWEMDYRRKHAKVKKLKDSRIEGLMELRFCQRRRCFNYWKFSVH